MECNEIAENIDALKIRFLQCKVLRASDLRLLVDLIEAVLICGAGGNGGAFIDYISNVVINQNNMVFTGVGNAFSGSLPIPQPVTLPTIGSFPSTSLNSVTSTTLEIGSNYNQQTTFSFNQGTIENQNNTGDTDLVGGIDFVTYSGTGINGTGLINTTVVAGIMNWSITVNYLAGTDPYFDSNGNIATNLANDRDPDSVSDTSNNITGSYRYWYDVGAVGSTPTVSADVRNLVDTGFVSEGTFDIIIPANQKEVAFYVPATFSLNTAVYVESSNADVSSTFTNTTLNVADGLGVLIPYKKYIATIGGIGYPSTATYRITIN